MISPNEIFDAIMLVEKLAILDKYDHGPLKLESLADMGIDLSQPPPRAGPLWDLLVSLHDDKVRDLYALMSAGRGDGSFVACLRDALGCSGDDMRRSIYGKRPDVLHQYWRAAIKRHPGDAQ